MTSSPLFISVAESIVILRPIRQVGCFSASSAVTSASSAGRAPAKRSAGRGQDETPDLRRRAAVQALVDRVVLAVDRQDRDAFARRRVGDDAAGHDEHFLVRERDRLAVLDGGEHRLEAVGAARRAQHEIDVRVRRDRDQAVASGAGQVVSPAAPSRAQPIERSPVAIAATRGR